VNLVVSGLGDPGDPNEINPGKYINVNWNDDDKDGWDPNDEVYTASYTGDKDDTNIVGGDSDFRDFTISISPSNIPQGSVTLSYPSNVKVWETYTKIDPNTGLSSETDGSYEPNQLPPKLYLEGISGSKEFRDVELKAAFSAGGSTIHEDVVKVTVFEVHLEGLYGFGPQQEDNEKHFDGTTASPPLQPVSSNHAGRISWDDKNADGIKVDFDPNCQYFANCMECQGTVDPNGFVVDPNGLVVDPDSSQNEFDFYIKQDAWARTIMLKGGVWITTDPNKNKWKPDSSLGDRRAQDCTPSDKNHVYAIDGPGTDLIRSTSITHYVQTADFKQAAKIKIDGVWYQCSNFHKWHTRLSTTKQQNGLFTRTNMIYQKLGDGWITVPDI